MARNQSVITWAAGLVLAFVVSLSAGVAQAQTTNFIADSGPNWFDPESWDNGVPNAPGVAAVLNQPIAPTGNGGTFVLSLNDNNGGAGTTVGSLTSNNDPTFSRFFVTQIQDGKLIFDTGSPSGVATLNEEGGVLVTTSNATRMRIVATVQLNSNLEVNSNHALDKNTNTEIVGRIDGSADKTITKKGFGNLQLDYGAPPSEGETEGFFGNLVIENGAVRLIVLNNGSEGTVNNVLHKSAGVLVKNGGQLQFGNIVTSVALGPNAELKLNGTGKQAPSNANNDGALLIADGATARNVTFNNPVNLQSDSRINVGAANVSGTLAQEVRGVGQLQKNGPGELRLNSANTYAGGTLVMQGALKVDGASATLGTGNVTVNGTTNGTFLSIETGVLNAIANTATLSLAGSDPVNGTADRNYVNLGAGVNEIIGGLVLGGTTMTPGIYGSTGSAAPLANQSDEFFAGTGIVTVSAAFLAADFNNSGAVDATDFNIWKGGFGSPSGQAKINGDANADGAVNGADFLVWQQQFGSGSGAVATAGAIPEPSAALLALLAAPLAAMIRRKR